MVSALSSRHVGQLAGLLFLAGGAMTLGYLFLPIPPLMSRPAVIAVSCVSLVIGLFCLLAPWDRWPRGTSLWLVAPAFVMIALGNLFGSTEPWTFGVFFIVAYAWIGLAHPRWTSLWFTPLATAAYVIPILVRQDTSPLGASSAIITIPVSLLVGESIAWLSTRERLSRERAEALARTAVAIGAHLDEDDVMQSLTDEARAALSSEHAALYRIDVERMAIREVLTSGIEEPARAYVKATRGTPLGGIRLFDQLLRDEAVIIEDARTTDMFPQEMAFNVKSVLVVPIWGQGELVGVLACTESSRHRRYSDADVSLARALAAHASVAIRNASLYQRSVELARCDPLTDLGNRRAFQEHLDAEIERARRYGRHLSLVLFDADRFKTVNDSWGHQTGDRVLQRLAILLSERLRQGDGAYRIGGDEFALILPETPASGAATLAERMRRAIERDRPVEDAPLTVSVGVASFPRHGDSYDALFSAADTALYEVKAAGGDAVAVVPEKRRTGPGVLFGVDIRDIVDNERVVPRYQPIVDIASATVCGYEAFARIDPHIGTTPTPTLFRAAKHLTLVEALDRLCRMVALLDARELPQGIKLFMNVHPMTLESPSFCIDDLAGPLHEVGLQPDRIVLEIVEQDRRPDSTELRRRLEECRTAGFGLALDDLGSGQADLELLSTYSFDYVKLDMAFVHATSADPGRRRMLSTLQAVASGTGATVIAEGVETIEDLQVIIDLEFPAAQGYCFGRPARRFEPPDLPEIMGPPRASSL